MKKLIDNDVLSTVSTELSPLAGSSSAVKLVANPVDITWQYSPVIDIDYSKQDYDYWDTTSTLTFLDGSNSGNQLSFTVIDKNSFDINEDGELVGDYSQLRFLQGEIDHEFRYADGTTKTYFYDSRPSTLNVSSSSSSTDLKKVITYTTEDGTLIGDVLLHITAYKNGTSPSYAATVRACQGNIGASKVSVFQMPYGSTSDDIANCTLTVNSTDHASMTVTVDLSNCAFDSGYKFAVSPMHVKSIWYTN